MRVGFEHTDDAKALFLRSLDVLLDRVRRVDDERLAARRIGDQVGGAAEIVVDELAEQHGMTLTPCPASFLEALAYGLGFTPGGA